MRVRIGCDLVHIPKFVAAAKASGFLARIFTEHELHASASLETLAGRFAAKEAVIKALDLPAGSWHSMEVGRRENGKPGIKLLKIEERIASHDISISHDGEYAMAIVVFVLEL